MKPNCIVCGSSANYFLDKDGYKVYECQNCNLSFVYPHPEQNFLKDEIYSEKSGYQANKKSDLGSSRPVHKHQEIINYLDCQKNRGSFLDIGCSNGEMMYHVSKLGYSTKGVELNPRTARAAKANGLDVFNGLLEDAGFKDKSFDYIYMGDLIEHVTDPARLLKDTYGLLKDSGQIIILTPNMDCFWAKMTFILAKVFKIPSSVITPPHHIWQFSVKNLKKLLENNGFQTISVWYTGAPSLKYELGCLHLLKRWKANRTIGSLLYMVFSFGIYTIIFGLNRIVELFPVKRFSMALVAQKSS